MTVKKFLMLKNTMPQFAVIEDEFRAGAVVYNYSGKKTSIRLRIKLDGAKLLDPDQKTVTVKKDGSADVRWKIRSHRPGKVTYKIAARSGTYTDAIERHFSVQVPRMTEAVAVYESMTGARDNQSLIIPDAKAVFPGAGRLEINLSSSAFVGMKGGIDYLMRYPYGCLEQKISRVFPIVHAKRLLLDMKMTDYTEAEMDGLVKVVLKKIGSYQRRDGGFSYWTSRRHTSAWLTAYACRFMLRASRAGYTIDNDILNKGLDYLKGFAKKDTHSTRYGYSRHVRLGVQAQIAYALALGGSADRTLINSVYQNIDETPFAGQAFLLRAMAKANYPASYLRRVRQELTNAVTISGTTAHFHNPKGQQLYWLHGSPTKATSQVLTAFVESRTQSPLIHKMVKWLVNARRRHGRFRNTQDNAAAFGAMTDYYRVYEKKRPNFKATVNAEGRELMNALFQGRSRRAAFSQVPFARFQRRGQKQSLSVHKKGPGRLYYELRLRYAPRHPPKSRSRGFKIVKTYQTLEGEKITNGRFIKGEEYVVTVKVYTDGARTFVALNDPLPAGLHPVNPSFQTTALAAYRDIKRRNRYWGSFSHFERYPDRMLAFANYMRRGEHIYRYVVRAVTPGTFLLSAAKVEQMYEPENFGYAGQRRVRVVER